MILGSWKQGKKCLKFLRLCDRAFMESNLPAFKEKNPQLEVVTELIRGQHPHLKGFYSKNSLSLSLSLSTELKIHGLGSTYCVFFSAFFSFLTMTKPVIDLSVDGM